MVRRVWSEEGNVDGGVWLVDLVLYCQNVCKMKFAH